MFVVPFIALCFSAPVAMILCLAWLVTTGHSDLLPTLREAEVLALSTLLISLALAILARPRRR
jgi:hypothetical protein